MKNSCERGGQQSWELKENEDGDKNSFRFEKNQIRWFSQKEYKCVFEGTLDHGGNATGYGTWIDTSYQGEFLKGFWKNGYPVGPFESMENDTRNILVNLRVIYGTNSGGSFLNRYLSLIYFSIQAFH